MYPYVRLAKEIWKARRAPRIGILDLHESRHICWPWDIDPWMELNNGRTLTLFDLGRVPMGVRMGLPEVAARNRWGMAIAGNSTRYRRRVTAFQRVTIRSRCLGWDDRFIYIDQTMWRGDACTTQMLARSAFTSAQGIVAPATVIAALGQDPVSPPLPDWVQHWIAADAHRPWPPQI
ncbi:thioeseterase [Gemmobacter lanyuensis]|uniref:Thioeseterase n=1 Tax=Gemmobacter lanyuensis TaxID=1054497 RepID=A0A918ML67_9RHOB|nr:acyl-CoA thioesterase [Gemmobacter lanyuensis]GGW33531.1 thioeseterase [Gemmobacter lanyuensis]